MSSAGDQHLNKQDSKRKRRALKEIPDVRTTEKSEILNWDSLHPERVVGMVAAVVDVGGAVILSRSADGGVLGIMVLHDDYEKKTRWARFEAEADQLLQDLQQHFIEQKDGE